MYELAGETGKMRKLFRRRSIFLLIVICTIVYICGKLFVMTTDTNDMAVYFSLREYSRNADLTGKLTVQARVPMRLVHDVNCESIMKGDKDEIARAKMLLETKNFTRKSISENTYIKLTKNCDQFKRVRYPMYYLSAEEVGFSVAYSILLYKDVEQTERLLRAIYSQVNYYCLHVDADAKKAVHDAIDSIANCFDNVFVVSRKEYVVYSGFTRLQADLTCMENLLQRGKDWKYFINLPSQQFPIKTNSEIAKILKIYNGSNDIEGLTGKRMLPYRYSHRYVYRHVKNEVKPRAYKTNQKKDDPPYNITVVKGSAYGIFSRDFVHFVTYDRKAREVLDWFRDVLSPDEYYWATLNYNPYIGTPGSYYKGKPDNKPWLAVFVAWGGENPCHGKYIRGICIFGVGDLHLLTKKPHLFANKFHIDFQPYALDCMEEWHFNKSTRGILDLNLTYYESLPFINRGR